CLCRSVCCGSLFSGCFCWLLNLRAQHRLLLGVGLKRDLCLRSLHARLGLALTLKLAPVAGQLEQCSNLLGGLCAHAEPVLCASAVGLDERGVFGRVVLADLFYLTTIALGARICDDDAVVGCPDLTETLQADLDSHGAPCIVNVTPCRWARKPD